MDVMARPIPENIRLLHQGEEDLRAAALGLIEGNELLSLHLVVTVDAMDLLDVLRQYQTEDEDIRAVQAIGVRTFNSLASAIKLLLSGYSQTATLLLRPVLEDVFLADFFRTDRSAISRWRLADKKTAWNHFSPIKIRMALDARDGFDTKKRAEMYQLFSDLAGHASMRSFAMLRPKGMGIHSGPFLDPTVLEAVLSELGRLSVQVGETFGAFMPQDWVHGRATLAGFEASKLDWLKTFYDLKS